MNRRWELAVVCWLAASLAWADDATVLVRVDGQPVTEGDLVEASTEPQRKRMTPDKFAEWQEYSRNKLLVAAVRGPLLKAYAEREGLGPTPAEKAGYVGRFRAIAKETADKTGVDPDDPGMARLREVWAEGAIREIKVGEALWREHGGSCGFGSLGSCTPFEAQEAFFKDEVEAGRLEFVDDATERRFWRAINDKRQMADVVLDDPKKIERMFADIRASWRPEPSESAAP